MTRGEASYSVARAVLAGSLAQNKMRTAVAICAIALGVALGLAVQLINQAAIGEFALGVQVACGRCRPRSARPRARLRRSAVPAARAPAGSGGGEPGGRSRCEVARPRGGAANRRNRCVSRRCDQSCARRHRRRSPRPAGVRTRLFVSPGRRALARGGGRRQRHVSGRARGRYAACGRTARARDARHATAAMDIAGVQWRFDRLSRLSRIDLRLVPGVDVAVLQQRIATLLPAGVAVVRPETSLAAGASLTRSYRVNLAVLALVALFTGGLLVFSTQALSVVRRRPQLALLRVLGVTRRRLAPRSLPRARSSASSAACSASLLGYAVAHLAVQVVGVDLGSGLFPWHGSQRCRPIRWRLPVSSRWAWPQRRWAVSRPRSRWPRRPGARAEGGRRGARIRAPAAGDARPRAARLGRRRDVRPSRRRLAAVWLHRHRAAAGRHAVADAATGCRSARPAADAALRRRSRWRSPSCAARRGKRR